MIGQFSSCAIQADLTLDLDGHPATVRADGVDIRVQASQPLAIWRQLTSASLPAGAAEVNPLRAVGQLADGLAAVGLQATLAGPTGAVVSLGRDKHSRWGARLTGSSHIQFEAPTAVGAALLAQLRGPAPRWTLPVGGVAAAGLVVGWRWWRRR
jgi:hypothetical protein